MVMKKIISYIVFAFVIPIAGATQMEWRIVTPYGNVEPPRYDNINACQAALKSYTNKGYTCVAMPKGK